MKRDIQPANNFKDQGRVGRQWRTFYMYNNNPSKILFKVI